MPVREAKQEDAGAIARVLHSVDWLWAAQLPLAELEQGVRQFLEAAGRSPDTTVFVAGAKGEAEAFLALHLFPALPTGYEGYVSHLFVQASARGHGLGQALLRAAEREAAASGCRRLLLYISHERPAYQRGFYAKAGWEERAGAALFVRYLEEE
jgi:GNAT superfamily N-acetyltransferase